MIGTNEQQIAIEEAMIEEAKRRYNREQEGAVARQEVGDTKAGRKYVKSLSRAMLKDNRLQLFMFPEKKVGRHHIASKLLRDTDIEPEVIAHLTAKAIMNCLTLPVFNKDNNGSRKQGIKRVTLARFIAELVHDEWRIREFNSSDKRKKLLKKLMKDFDKRTYPREWRRRTIKNYFEAEQISWEGWTVRQKVVIGNVLLRMFVSATTTAEGPFIEGFDNDQQYCMSDVAMAQADLWMNKSVRSYILYKPMVVKPRPWTEEHLFRGGYVSNRVKRYAIVKGSTKRDVLRFADMDWSRVLPAVNALQETPWRVNKEVLEAVDWAYNTLTERDEFKNGIGKLVSSKAFKLPPKPPLYDENLEVKKAHNKVVFLLRSKNRENKSRQIAARMAISTAKQFSHYEAIYMPHNLDSRGRAYPLPAVLNPQGPDYIKAMLEYGRGYPIQNEEQSSWLAIAGANAYGNDKVSLAERVEWVKQNEQMILEIAADWKHDLRWTRHNGKNVSEPFGFLRFCLEWKAFRDYGFGYVSHMVCPVDATCSGLQHYSAMLRDSIGGKAVNLVPGLSRQDVYGDVKDVVLSMCRTDLSSSETIGYGKIIGKDHNDNDIKEYVVPVSVVAQHWLDYGLTRSHTKRQVMVVPYAGKFSSCLAYTKSAVADDLFEGKLPKWDHENDDLHHEYQVYLAKKIWTAIGQVVVSAREGMKWLSSVATAFSKKVNDVKVTNPYDRRMTWYTPDDFEVVHYREDETKTQVDTTFDGRVQLVVYEYNGMLNPKDMALAVAPNFVHALDACLLRITVMKALDVGIKDFGMIHDSFGCHAAFMPDFINKCIKPAFVEMYEEHDVLQEFHDQYANVVPDIKAPPAKGHIDPATGERVLLDLQGVLKSEFFFS